VPRLVTETRSFIDEFPVYLQTFSISPHEILLSENGERSLMDSLLQFKDVLGASSTNLLALAATVFGGVMSFFLIVVLSFYFAVQDRGLDDFIRMVTPYRKQEYVLDLWKRAQHKMGRWLQGQLLLSFIVGAMAYVGLLILGVPYALLLAIFTALFELVPVFGSILAAIPAVAVALIDGGTTSALLVIALYVIVNQLQGNVIYPIVVQKVLGIPPLVVILAILAGAKLGSYLGSAFLGILIAVPLAAAVQVYLGDIQRGKHPGEDDKNTIIA
jgi:predicted PurR-regulated permease PerM